MKLVETGNLLIKFNFRIISQILISVFHLLHVCLRDFLMEFHWKFIIQQSLKLKSDCKSCMFLLSRFIPGIKSVLCLPLRGTNTKGYKKCLLNLAIVSMDTHLLFYFSKGRFLKIKHFNYSKLVLMKALSGNIFVSRHALFFCQVKRVPKPTTGQALAWFRRLWFQVRQSKA